MEFPDARLLIFAKAPIPGQVKTRLIPFLGASGAAALHEQLARQTLATAVNARLCPVQLWCWPDPNHAFFKDCRERYCADLYSQSGSGLGARMAHACEQTLRQAPYVIIIGTDCPGLSREDLSTACTALAQGHDAVIGPAEDGGYILLGLRTFAPILFDNMPWGSADVLDATRACFKQLRWRWRELPLQWDVDRPEDVERLLRDPAFDLDAAALANEAPHKSEIP